MTDLATMLANLDAAQTAVLFKALAAKVDAKTVAEVAKATANEFKPTRLSVTMDAIISVGRKAENGNLLNKDVCEEATRLGLEHKVLAIGEVVDAGSVKAIMRYVKAYEEAVTRAAKVQEQEEQPPANDIRDNSGEPKEPAPPPAAPPVADTRKRAA